MAKVDAFANAPRFSSALWGIKVISLDRGKVLFEHHADRLLSPASNAKLYVGAVALDRLGGDYQIITPLLATSAVDATGTIHGDLVVAGRGDPSWNSRWEKRDFWTSFDPFVAELTRAGVRAITGDLVADATYFRDGPAGDGWTAGDLNDYYGAEVSALTLEDNYVDVRVLPGKEIGAPCTIELLQPLSGIEVDNRTQTVAANGARVIRVVRTPGENVAIISGTLPLAGKEELTEITIPRPAAWFATALKAALERKGIHVQGGTRSVRWPERVAAPSATVKIGEVKSPPLRELVRAFMKPSQNLQTDLVFLHLGETRRTAKTSVALGSNDLALAELHAFLCENALRADDVHFDEGSGLSRNDLTTAAATATLLRFMTAHRERAVFEAALPQAGVDGTLRRRFKGSPLVGKLNAKTGTLRWASSLSGYLTAADGEHLVVSLMLNRYAGVGGREARDEVEELVTLIAGYDASP